MSNLSGLPPSALARAASLAATQDVAVRLINLPDSLKSNAGSLTLSGTVIGQNKDGSLNIDTDHGIVTILLKDRGALPAGQKIEIEIPAGRPPQQAAIRPQALAQPLPLPPVVPPPLTAPPLPLKLDRDAVLRADDIAEALAALPLDEIILPAAPLQAGQIVRLLPLQNTPQANLPTLSDTNLGAISTPQELFTAIVNLITQAPEIPEETKQNLIQILKNVDIASLLPQTATQTQPESQEAVKAALQKLTQALETQTGVKLQNAQFLNGVKNTVSTPSQPINPAKPLDVKILAFQTPLSPPENFETALKATSPQTPIPILPKGNFITVPQIQVPASPQATTTVPQGASTTAPQSVPTSALPSTSAPTLLGQAVIGQVAGFTPAGQPIIALNLPNASHPHLYVAQFATSNIAVGAPVIVAPLPTSPIIQGALQQTTTTTQASITFGADQSLVDFATGGEWTTLQTLMTSLTHLNPALAQPLIQMMPSASAPQNFGALSLFILSVMRSGIQAGDIENWLDEPTMETLKQSGNLAGNLAGKLDILRALTGESAMMSKLETAALPNTPHNDWKATMLPFWHQGQVNKLPLYFKKWNDDSGNVEGVTKKTTRFLFNLKLSRMGDVQVDGFVQKEKMDMILRTKARISPSMQQAIRATYTKAMERSNFAGEITFQFKPEQWVEVGVS